MIRKSVARDTFGCEQVAEIKQKFPGHKMTNLGEVELAIFIPLRHDSDSVDAAVWRALAVALAVVGRRGHADEGCEDTTNSLQRTNS